ncbi:MAG TPA: alanine racemase [Gemmatimonadales bacterium]|nr:alanine racemase [Gemmatimonadales bacterium]
MTSIPEQTARAWAEVNLGAVVANARTVATVAGTRLLPMVKANGYGVGAVPVTRALEAIDPWGYGVVTVQEGAELRAAGITRPIVVFSPLTPQLVGAHLSHGLRPTIGDANALSVWRAAGSKPFHIEIDTGMSRSGFRFDAESSWRDQLVDAEGWEGVFTHFHSADQDDTAVRQQWDRFRTVLALLPGRPPLVHAANSAAALLGKTYACDMVRPGIFLYGGAAGGYSAEPVVRLRAPVVAVREVKAGDTVSYGATWKAPRDCRVATLSIGYGDGLLRSLSNQGAVEIGGRVLSIVGRVTMDFTMFAIDQRVAIGDIATLFGGLVSVDEQARRAGTVSYELLTAMGVRVERRYQ